MSGQSLAFHFNDTLDKEKEATLEVPCDDGLLHAHYGGVDQRVQVDVGRQQEGQATSDGARLGEGRRCAQCDVGQVQLGQVPGGEGGHEEAALYAQSAQGRDPKP